MADLAKKRCVPCEEGGEPLAPAQAHTMMQDISPEWMLLDDARLLARSFKFKNFAESIAFVDKVAAIAEEEGHHPDISISYDQVSIELSTHAVEGLSENDFILAAKIDEIGK
jgi:4a-hydroxytetrahydrobiopterin dehydratase